MAANSKVRDLLSKHFLEALSKGTLPWAECWQQVRPMNATTGKLYRGVNALMLSYIAGERGYGDPRWCTYKQAQDRGWQVRKGEKATPVEYWAYYDRQQKKLLSWAEARSIMKSDFAYAEKNLLLTCRTHVIFNAEQIDGIPELEQPKTNIGMLRQQRDTLIRNMGIGYREFGNEAYYSPNIDIVTLPPEASFHDTYSYMATFFHECGHATGHPDRLNRDLTGSFGSEEYAREELKAEIASAFTAQELGLQLDGDQLQKHIDHHAAYVQHWASILQKSPDELFRAIKAAEAISDYIIEKGCFHQMREIISGRIGDAEYTVSPRAAGGLLLRFFGIGSIPECEDLDTRPYQSMAADIREIQIDGGITSIGRGTLSDLPNVEKISVPSQLKTSHYENIYDCAALREIEFTGAGRQPTGRGANSLHSPRAIMELAEKYPGMLIGQYEEIYAGLQSGMAAEQVDIYAKAEYSASQMNALRYSLCDGLTSEQIKLIANPRFGPVQMDIIRSGFQCGMTLEEVSSYARPELTPGEMLDEYWNIRNSHIAHANTNEDKAPQATAEEEEKVVWELDKHLKAGGDIADLATWYEKDLSPEY